ncbi:hypothetical protein DFA_11761 [Cavenderia fasciculata]|uniref:Uncharacterized protein n=1 Tax=Cavenderia fasciculata TaxID=261658 RepID=F4QE53_CACFS|nr:uncharacterized protein DFA_11761 [Cavenderia fasciculata]EGG14000.1 hypothetical protein DFA_11761 [Cavenderia fasciculata]|eukprot:XP_004350708.1 hypothetical protein DFA_11761 [Cavenderia fasciculata]
MTHKHEGEVTIPYELYQKTVDEVQQIKTKHLITYTSYAGIAEFNEINLQVELHIRVFQSERCAVPLMGQKATMIDSTITFVDPTKGVSVDGDTVNACIITSQNYYHLYTSTPGRYIVKVTLSVPYLTSKKTGMELMIPQSSNNNISFRVPQSNANIKIFNSFPDIESTEEYEKKSGKETNNQYTMIFSKLPQETLLRVQWTFKSETQVPNNNNNNNLVTNIVKTKPNVNVLQNTLGSIGEGLLILKSTFNYRIVSGTLSVFNITIEKNVNIISVDGEAIKKWEVVDIEKPESSTQPRMLQVHLDYGVENNYELSISAEYNMRDTSAEVRIPIMVCKGEEISRQRGFLAIEARTNVEISEIGCLAADVIDVQELPIQLSRLATHPILLGYKYLDPTFELVLKVKKNLDVPVLVSICEASHFISTVSDTGRVIHQMVLLIKNTQKQFLRIQLPFEYDLWSTLMDGTPIRPSCINNDNESSPILLVPLLKPAGAKSLHSDSTSVQIEVVLLEKNIRPIAKSSSMTFTMPRVDLPLRSVSFTLYLPQKFMTKNFEGNLKKVTYYSQTPPAPILKDASHTSNNSNNNNNAYGGKRGRGGYSDDDDEEDEDFGGATQINSLLKRNESMDSFEYNSKGSSLSFSKKSKAPARKGAGLIPVRVEMPTTTNQVMFEQILLSGDNDLTVSFDYKQYEQKVVR